MILKKYTILFICACAISMIFMAGVFVGSHKKQVLLEGASSADLISPFQNGEGQEPSLGKPDADRQTNAECPVPPPLPSLSLTQLYICTQTGALYIFIDGEIRQVVITDTDVLRLEFAEDLL